MHSFGELFTANYLRVSCNFFMRFQRSKFTRNLKIPNIAKYLDHLAISKMEESAAICTFCY